MDMKEKPTMVVVSVEDWEEYQELKKNREKNKANRLEVGKDYINRIRGLYICIDRKGDRNNHGFFNGEFRDTVCCETPDQWVEATEEEIIQTFEKECVRRLGEDWREVKIKKCMFHGFDRDDLNKGECFSWIIKTKDGWTVWNKNGCVYYEGKWAEKLEEPKFAESLGSINRPFYIANSKVVRCDTMQSKDNLPTKELAEGVLALTQLLSFRHDVWEKEGKPEDDEGWFGIMLTVSKEEPRVIFLGEIKTEFRFKKKETAEWFLETHRELLTEYQDKLIK